MSLAPPLRLVVVAPDLLDEAQADEDQARLVNQTFYIVNPGEKMSSLAKILLRSDAIDYIKRIITGID